MTSTSRSTYTLVADLDSEKGEQESFLEQTLPDKGSGLRLLWSKQYFNVLPWILSVFFAAFSFFLLLHPPAPTPSSPYGSYKSGFETDIDLQDEIPLELVRFTRSPHFYANGTGYLNPVDENLPWPENMILFGPPSKEIDKNWERLIGARYFSVSEEEAKKAWGERRSEFVDERIGGYTAGLDVFHTLHCVNALRMALYPEHYKGRHLNGPFHAEHCLDVIRQAVQCYGSTTLIPTKFRNGLQHNYIDSDQLHTCRSFTFLRSFVDSRRKGGESYVERDQSLLNRKKHEIAMAWDAARHERHNHHGHHRP